MQSNHASKAPRTSSRLLPDAQWIRKEIPISEVARQLGLRGDGRVFDCFRDHSFGKRRRCLSVHAARNAIRCFQCDNRSLSNIDLVMAVKGCEVGAAIRWFQKKFNAIPTVQVRCGQTQRRYVPRGGRTMTLQDLVTSRGWATMSPAAKIVISAIFSRTPAAGSEQGCLRCTYDLLRNWTGIRSRATIAAALKELREAKAIHVGTVSTNFRTRRGFWLKELFVRVSSRAMAVRQKTKHPTATSYSVQEMNSQYAVQNLNSSEQSLQDWTTPEGMHVQ